jgi:hypothetical protein
MPPMPKVKLKSWEKADKKYLANLISVGDINIGNTFYSNIEDVQLAYFPHRDVKNFRRNFRDFTASLDLETKYTCARQCKAGKVAISFLHFNVDC